jgi:separase
MEFEPEGVVSSYLAAGAPCVLGNLWDVSDKDIDRFCIEFMGQFLEGKGERGKAEYGGKRDVAECIATSRGVCKMRYLVAAAVVCYGMPAVFAGGAK